jgi:ribosomal protein S18 acetylase RimI-like enzyme
LLPTLSAARPGPLANGINIILVIDSALGLHTSESMQVAMRLYERMGFVRAPEYDFSPGGGELVKAYCLSLDRAARDTAGG